MRRGAWLVVTMIACACSGPAEPACTPGESRACTCPSGAAGAQVCADDGTRLGACVCAELDAGVSDAGRELDASQPLRDAGARDAYVPPRPDAGPPDAGPPWGECWLATQAGCEDGQACRLPRYADDGGVREPRCEWPQGDFGPGTGGHPCCDQWCFDSEGRDLCAPGLFCGSAGGASGCLRYCDPDGEACPARSDGTPQTCRAGMSIDGHEWYACL